MLEPIITPTVLEVYYFGCWGQPGHFWFLPGGAWPKALWLRPVEAVWPWIDGGWAPRHWKQDRNTYRALVKDPTCCFVMEGRTPDERRQIRNDTEEYDQGEFLCHVKDGWTLMSWWDRTQGDHRSACNSSIIARAELPCDQMYALLCKHFPSVAQNLVRAGVTLREVVRS